jgi:hypothetical protein
LSHSAGSLASLLRPGAATGAARPVALRGHVDDEGSALWARYEGTVEDEGLEAPLAG